MNPHDPGRQQAGRIRDGHRGGTLGCGIGPQDDTGRIKGTPGQRQGSGVIVIRSGRIGPRADAHGEDSAQNTLVDRDGARNERSGGRARVEAGESDLPETGLGQAGGIDRAAQQGRLPVGGSVKDGFAGAGGAEDPIIGIILSAGRTEDHASGLTDGGGGTYRDTKGTGDGDVADAEGLDGGVRRQRRGRGDISNLGGGGSLEGGRGGGSGVSHRHQAVGSGRDERRRSGGELIDDPRGDHAVGGGDGRTVQAGGEELGVGTEVGRQTRQGHRTRVLADQVGGGDDGIIGRGGTLLDRDEVSALHLDRTEGLGNERGRRGRARHAQITAAQVEDGRGGETEIATGDGKGVAAEHEAGGLSGGDREAAIKDVDGRITQLRRGASVVTADLEEARDVKKATGREDVLQRRVRDQQLALPIHRGATAVGLDGVQQDDAALVTRAPNHRTRDRITDDQRSGGAAEDARA